jgi:hypothetical protein
MGGYYDKMQRLPNELICIISKSLKNPYVAIHMRKVCHGWRRVVPKQQHVYFATGYYHKSIQYWKKTNDILNMYMYLTEMPLDVYGPCATVHTIFKIWQNELTDDRVDQLIRLLRYEPLIINQISLSFQIFDHFNKINRMDMFYYGNILDSSELRLLFEYTLFNCADDVVKKIYQSHAKKITSVTFVENLIAHCFRRHKHQTSDKMKFLMEILIDHCGLFNKDNIF